MPFLRSRNGYFYLVESIRSEGKVRQKSIAYLGKPEGAIARLQNSPLSEVDKQRFAEQIKPFIRIGTALESPLKWAGGKRRMLPDIRPFWSMSKAKRLVEPFCGGLNVALGLAPEKALLNDVNFHLINLYQQIQKGLQLTIELEPSRFEEYRDRFNAATDPYSADSAQLFYYLLRSCHGGLCRFNAQGKFNVNVQHGKVIYPDLAPYTSAFQGWAFTAGDFEQLQIKRTDFVYADPPYDDVAGKTSFAGYFGRFDWSGQERLAKWLGSLPCPVLASNHDTDRIRCLYQSIGFTVMPINAHRGISSDGDRTAAREVLLWKSK